MWNDTIEQFVLILDIIQNGDAIFYLVNDLQCMIEYEQKSAASVQEALQGQYRIVAAII